MASPPFLIGWSIGPLKTVDLMLYCVQNENRSFAGQRDRVRRTDQQLFPVTEILWSVRRTLVETRGLILICV